jgi:hypothetical protein
VPIESTAIPFSETIKNSRLLTVKDGLHGIAWTHADLVNRELLAFLKRDAWSPPEPEVRSSHFLVSGTSRRLAALAAMR